MPESHLPLSGLRVLDLPVARAGPTAVRQLGDWGAEVIRIEPPGKKDDIAAARRHGHDFQNLHRNKRCMTLDLKSDEGRDIFYRLVENADVVIENFRAAVKDRLGIAYPTLRDINPRLVMGSISGFGQTGPYRDRPGVDQIAQGLGGLMSVTGLPGQGPARVGTAISDLAAGLYLSFGILAALHERQSSGQGQWVHTSLLEAMIGMLDFQAARWLVEGEVAGQMGNDHPTIAPMGTYDTAHGLLNIAASSGRQFVAFCRAIGADELLGRPEYADTPARIANRAALREDITGFLLQRTADEWVPLLNEAGVPCGPVNTIDQTFADPQVRHLGIATPVAHPTLGELELVGQPIHLERTPFEMRRAAPEAGEHTREILSELGFSEEGVKKLEDAGVV